MSPDAPHILVIDDDTRLRDLLQRYLREEGFRVTTATDASDARARLSSMDFDLLVLDVMMPGESGLDLTRWLRREKRAPVLLLTAMGDTEHRIAGLESGADDYLTKPFDPRELTLRINAILRRAQIPLVKTESEIHFGPFCFDLNRDELRKGDNFIRLTAAEASLLRALARQPGVAVSRDHLTAESPVIGTARAIDVQVTRLRRKIEQNPKYPRYLQAVRGVGYILMAD
ncbi:MAG: response regulator transcription factor [Proteobacteria bacterium]|nr:response regulator transcription factor [Pseudomonadota bacterium]